MKRVDFSPYLPVILLSVVLLNVLWASRNLGDAPCRTAESSRPVYMRKLHLNDSDIDNVVVLNETVTWPPTIVVPKQFHVGRNLSFLVVVHSEVYNFDRRHELRAAFSKQLRNTANFDVLFVTARPMEQDIQKALIEEAEEFDDVVQSFHIDSYHSIPMKAHAWISYLHEHFLNSTKYVVKIDDDVNVNVALVANFLDSRSRSESERAVYCYPVKHIADKREGSKFYVSNEEFPFRNLGIFCSGLAYTLSADLLPHLHRNIQRTRFVWLDDWYITHALLVDVDFTIYDTSAFYFTSETRRQAFRLLRRVLDGYLPTPWFSHLRPRETFDRKRQLEFWRRTQLCSDGFRDPLFVNNFE